MGTRKGIFRFDKKGAGWEQAGGEKLVMGSTTGSVWVSGDQGDRWESLSAHLPPVYCVRFEEG